MSSEYIEQATMRALESIEKLTKEGKKPTGLELSSDVWAFIQIGGFNHFPTKKIFIGLEVIEREDLKDHIRAV